MLIYEGILLFAFTVFSFVFFVFWGGLNFAPVFLAKGLNMDIVEPNYAFVSPTSSQSLKKCQGNPLR